MVISGRPRGSGHIRALWSERDIMAYIIHQWRITTLQTTRLPTHPPRPHPMIPSRSHYCNETNSISVIDISTMLDMTKLIHKLGSHILAIIATIEPTKPANYIY